MNCKILADLCQCFHRLSINLCPDLVSFACWNVPEFWLFTHKSTRLGRSRSKLCQILCRLRNKLCPDFGCSRAILCPIYFAPCPFPNLVAGTLRVRVRANVMAGACAVGDIWLILHPQSSKVIAQCSVYLQYCSFPNEVSPTNI